MFEEAANKVDIDKKETEKRYLDNVKQLEGIIAKVNNYNFTIYLITRLIHSMYSLILQQLIVEVVVESECFEYPE